MTPEQITEKQKAALKSAAAWIKHWRVDVECKLKPTPESLDMAAREIALALELDASPAPEQAVSPWQPIATAPKDGTHILASEQKSVGLDKPDISIVSWDERDRDWVGMCDGCMSIKSQGDLWTSYHYPYVTHWMPLPKPPEPDA